MSFIDELKRRNVFRVGIAYALSAWVVLQVLAGAALAGPDMRIAIAAHIGGFIAGLALARPLARP